MTDHYAIVQDELEALYERTVRRRYPAHFAGLLFLEHGSLRIEENEQDVEAPALCFWPQKAHTALTLAAGSRARILGLSDTILLDAIGARSESVHLRMLVEQPFIAPLEDPHVLAQIEALFRWFVTETEDAAQPSPMSLAAFLRLMLISALRAHQPDGRDAGSEQTSLLRRFRHLVELHYRDHWQVAHYAEKLGIEYDRLHRICKRETGRSPAELVHERLTAEAKARLENSGIPLKKIAADLGFSDASRFSHFFKRRTDMSPGAYRAIVSRPTEDDLSALRSGFADWP